MTKISQETYNKLMELFSKAELNSILDTIECLQRMPDVIKLQKYNEKIDNIEYYEVNPATVIQNYIALKEYMLHSKNKLN